ncbi:hypothetical protein C8T65DRAFT_734678 [Cerioporus squamosus]|nr:hypothetical protein C8T65DRAFT_734678 [Cerioporus squamosus]
MSETRNTMPREGKGMREELYRNCVGHVPEFARKIEVYKDMCAHVPGITGWYTVKKHLNWCYKKEKKLGIQTKDPQGLPDVYVHAFVEAEMTWCPDPSLSVLSMWASMLEVPNHVVYKVAAAIAGVQ